MPIHLPASGHRRVPWRNGGGVTDEIAVQPSVGDPTRFAWRLSMAHVESAGPFSEFPGVDRILMLIDGAGMELRIGDQPWRRFDRPFEAISFAGETPVECRLLDGPVRDFNVMIDRATTRAKVRVAAGETIVVNPAHEPATLERVVAMLAGTASVSVAAGSLDLGLHDALRIGPEEGIVVDVAPTARAALVTFFAHVAAG